MSDKLRKATILPLLLAAAGVGAGAVADEAQPSSAPLERVRVEDVEPQSTATPAPEPEPRWVGPYRLLRELGTGGMGTVYLAESNGPRPRRVALKLIREGPGATELSAQFEVERRALAVVDHDFVARLYDSGTSADGRPWIAMEYVAGEPLTDYCDRRRLDVEARLRLFIDVCEAVGH
ncbi:MAG: serine/threonine protein kinase, partial [Planctomycetes bacterium]|nr:serine/threonine protein kinase [Planctomycetota bacterium]